MLSSRWRFVGGDFPVLPRLRAKCLLRVLLLVDAACWSAYILRTAFFPLSRARSLVDGSGNAGVDSEEDEVEDDEL